MGLGRIYHTGFASLPAIGAGSRADLQLVEHICSSGQTTVEARSHHQSPVVDVFGGTKNRTCGSNNHHADWTAFRFRQGSGSADASFLLASGMGCSRYGAVKIGDGLEPGLRPSQVCSCRKWPATKHPITHKFNCCGWLTAFFRFISRISCFCELLPLAISLRELFRG